MPQRLSVMIALLAASALVRADAGDLEEAVQDAIRKAEPSIACILVSRDPVYRKLEGRPRDDSPGKLGDFPRVSFDPLNPQDDRYKRDMSQGDYVPESFGSGIVLDKSGSILTCAHVVQGATKIFVRLPGGVESYADIVALDGRSDLAVIRLSGKVPVLKPIVMGDGEGVKKGQLVVALSNPYAAGFRDGSPSASTGIIGNLRRRAVTHPNEKDRQRLCLHQFSVLLMTDAKLSLGSSGGALVNRKGEAIGVTTSLAALAGVETPGGFALPLDTGIRRIIDTLREGKEVEYGFLGVRFTPGGEAVRLAETIPNSPASRAGLRGSEYIVSVGGMKIRDVDDIFVAVGTMLAGNAVEIETSGSVGGQTRKVKVTLGKYHTQQPFLATNRPKPVGGLRVDDACLHVQRGGFAFGGVPEGVLIREVEPGSPADLARLQPDKIITHVNRRAVNSPAEFLAATADLRRSVDLTIRKPEGGSEQITLKLE